MPINWADHAPPSTDSDRWKPETVGDKIEGTITGAREITSQYGSCPVLDIDDGTTVRAVFISQAQLLRKCAELAPTVGDLISIEYVDNVELSGGRTMKEFVVSVTRSEAAEPVTAEDLGF